MLPRRLVVAMIVGVLALAGAGAAHAAMTARLTAAQTVTSAAWGVSPTGAARTPLALTWVQAGELLPNIFTVTNTGNVPLTGTTWAMTAVRSDGNGNGTTPVVQLDACVGATWTELGTCLNGTVVRIGTTANGVLAVASTVTAGAAGSTLSVRAILTKVIGSGVTATLSTSVGPTQITLPNKTINS